MSEGQGSKALRWSKILFTPASNILAHVSRCVVLARELQDRGLHVISEGSSLTTSHNSAQPRQFAPHAVGSSREPGPSDRIAALSLFCSRTKNDTRIIPPQSAATTAKGEVRP